MNSRRVSMVTLHGTPTRLPRWGPRHYASRYWTVKPYPALRDQQIYEEVAHQREHDGHEQDGPPAPPKCQTENHESERQEDRKRTHSAPRRSLRRFRCSTLVWHETIVRRHLHLRERRRVDDRVRRNQLVEEEQVRHEAVDLVVPQRSRRVGRHRATNVVEHRRRVRPVAADGLGRSWIAREGKRVARHATDEDVVRSFFSRFAVAACAARRVDRRTVGGRTASLREPSAIGPDVDIERGDFRRRGGSSDAEGRRLFGRGFRRLRLRLRRRDEQRGDRDDTTNADQTSHHGGHGGRGGKTLTIPPCPPCPPW